jgi:hypothetical protein
MGITLSTEFSESTTRISPLTLERPVITMRRKLLQMGARCNDGKLYDRWGKKIIFHRMVEMGGPRIGPKYQKEVDEDRELLRKEEAEGTVIRMYATRDAI